MRACGEAAELHVVLRLELRRLCRAATARVTDVLFERSVEVDIGRPAFRALAKRVGNRAGAAVRHREVETREVLVAISLVIAEVSATRRSGINQVPAAGVANAAVIILLA